MSSEQKIAIIIDSSDWMSCLHTWCKRILQSYIIVGYIYCSMVWQNLSRGWFLSLCGIYPGNRVFLWPLTQRPFLLWQSLSMRSPLIECFLCASHPVIQKTPFYSNRRNWRWVELTLCFSCRICVCFSPCLFDSR